MAVLFISEYPRLAIDAAGAGVPIGVEPGTDQTVAIGGVSTQSNAFRGGTKMVRLHTDSICHVLFGEDPTASSANKRMAAGQTEFFGVREGHKLAVIVGV